jgi:hypothetical protein
MGATLGRVISNYRALVETCKERASELELSRLEIDRIGGLPAGYAGKLLGNGFAKRPKRMWPVGLEAMLGALGLKIILIEDDAATARTLALRTPVDRANQRFGNKCNSPKLLSNVESIKLAGHQNSEPAPVSRAHLRVVRSKRGSKYG